MDIEEYAKKFVTDNHEIDSDRMGLPEYTAHALVEMFLAGHEYALENSVSGFDAWWNSEDGLDEIMERAGKELEGVTNMSERCTIMSEFWAREAFTAAKLSAQVKYDKLYNDLLIFEKNTRSNYYSREGAEEINRIRFEILTKMKEAK